jgi:ribonucleoside-diphosphate reductase alpha chain
MSSGSRRGAMMATLHCEHPDLPAFIEAKHKPDELTNFNISVVVTDAFMNAVKENREWSLGFTVPSADPTKLLRVERRGDQQYFVYNILPARGLWDMILRSTYAYSEPGVIFTSDAHQPMQPSARYGTDSCRHKMRWVCQKTRRDRCPNPS